MVRVVGGAGCDGVVASLRLRRRIDLSGRPPRYDTPGSTRNRRRSASRPTNIRNPISSRRVNVTSAVTLRPARTSEVWTTGRCSISPDELFTSRVATTAASATTESLVERCHGWTSKRTHGVPSRSNHSSPNACIDEVRAPVSIFALRWATFQSGSATHSRHPNVVGSGRLAGDTRARYRASLPEIRDGVGVSAVVG